MKKVLEVIKKVLVWLGTILAAVTAICFCKKIGSKNSPISDFKEDDSDEINRKAEAKRKETIERISNADAPSICESYGSVCDAIADGKERFRKRCQRTDD